MNFTIMEYRLLAMNLLLNRDKATGEFIVNNTKTNKIKRFWKVEDIIEYYKLYAT